MSRCVKDQGEAFAEAEQLVVFEFGFRLGDGGGASESEHAPLHVEVFVEEVIAGVKHDLAASAVVEFFGAPNVVDVGMGVNDFLDRKIVVFEDLHDLVDVAAGVDDDGFFGVFAAEDGAVALKKSDGEGFDNHGGRFLGDADGLELSFDADGDAFEAGRGAAVGHLGDLPGLAFAAVGDADEFPFVVTADGIAGAPEARGHVLIVGVAKKSALLAVFDLPGGLAAELEVEALLVDGPALVVVHEHAVFGIGDEVIEAAFVGHEAEVGDASDGDVAPALGAVATV